MQIEDAAGLIRDAVEGHGTVWADMGAGRGTFTRALVGMLGAPSKVFALDRDAAAIAEIERWAADEKLSVVAVQADFSTDFAVTFPEPLDGLLFANSLHFIKDAGALLAGLVKFLRPGGRVVLVEYDRRAPSRWVPFPIGIADLPKLAAAAGLSRFTVSESRPSNYEGVIYSAYADKPVSE